MTKQQITEHNERIGRESFQHFTDNLDGTFTITNWSKNIFSKWDVSYTSGATQDFIIGEIKYRESYNENAFDTWILEEEKHKALLRLKRIIQRKYPHKKVFIHYINFYKDNRTKPRIWDITEPTTFATLELPNNSNTSTAYFKNKPATLLHNNKAINL